MRRLTRSCEGVGKLYSPRSMPFGRLDDLDPAAFGGGVRGPGTRDFVLFSLCTLHNKVIML